MIIRRGSSSSRYCCCCRRRRIFVCVLSTSNNEICRPFFFLVFAPTWIIFYVTIFCLTSPIQTCSLLIGSRRFAFVCSGNTNKCKLVGAATGLENCIENQLVALILEARRVTQKCQKDTLGRNSSGKDSCRPFKLQSNWRATCCFDCALGCCCLQAAPNN